MAGQHRASCKSSSLLLLLRVVRIRQCQCQRWPAATETEAPSEICMTSIMLRASVCLSVPLCVCPSVCLRPSASKCPSGRRQMSAYPCVRDSDLHQHYCLVLATKLQTLENNFTFAEQQLLFGRHFRWRRRRRLEVPSGNHLEPTKRAVGFLTHFACAHSPAKVQLPERRE